jgi:energy-coupling factor transport system substrate-specific component
MSWQAASLVVLAIAIGGGFIWFERSRPPARIVAAVAALAALAVAGRIVLAPIPNVVATTDVALLAGYALGGGPGFAVGALAGLVSNFWLGQGPWTPWQMAGWGMVGVGGAVLARLSGRRLGRWQLALWAALAGLAYGALLDLSVMVSYGGEQSIDRYVALSARGIPFNVAHAVGNFTLMLAAGPAMVRMLDRYRDRFDFAWRDAPIGRAALCLVVALAVALPLLVPGGADARGGGNSAKVWLLDTQNKNGGYGTDAKAESSVGMTGWAMLGMESAGLNPLDNRRAGNTPVDYLRRNATSISSTGDLERTILALVGAGEDPRAFAGRDLVAELRERQNRDGSYQQQINLTAYAILAMRAGKVDHSRLGKPAKWLRKAQNKNGGWGSVPGANSEPDSTGAVMQALAVAPGGKGQIKAAVKWLRNAQHGTGGWSLVPHASSNTQSTAWAVQGLVAAGKNPGKFSPKRKNPYEYLKRRQREDGHYEYSSASDQTPIWVTAQGLSAAFESEFPLRALPRLPKPKPKPEDTTSNTGTSNYGDYGDYGNYGDTGSYNYDSSGADLGNLYNPGGNHSSSGHGDKNSSGPKLGNALGGAESETSGANRQRIPANSDGLDPSLSTAPEAASADEDNDKFEAPATPVLLGGLGGLSAVLGAGFLWFRRRLP